MMEWGTFVFGPLLPPVAALFHWYLLASPTAEVTVRVLHIMSSLFLKCTFTWVM